MCSIIGKIKNDNEIIYKKFFILKYFKLIKNYLDKIQTRKLNSCFFYVTS